MSFLYPSGPLVCAVHCWRSIANLAYQLQLTTLLKYVRDGGLSGLVESMAKATSPQGESTCHFNPCSRKLASLMMIMVSIAVGLFPTTLLKRESKMKLAEDRVVTASLELRIRTH